MNKLAYAAILSVAGGARCLFVLVNVGRASDFGSNGLTGLLATMLASLVLGGAGFVFFLGWRDGRKTSRRAASPPPLGPRPAGTLAVPPTGVYALRPGVTYRILKPFTDYHQGSFRPGEELIFVSRNFLPYHGGHTVVFHPRTIYLQEELHAEILGRMEEYLEPVERVAKIGPATVD